MQYRKQTTSSSLPSLSVLLPLLPLFLSLLGPQPCSGLDVGRLCAIRCKLGKGGNLCHCNAFHFAGKRGHEGVAATAAAGSGREDVGDNNNDDDVGEAFPLGPRSWLELALRDMEEEEEEKEKQEEGEIGNPARTLGVSGLSLTRGARLSQPGKGEDLVLGQRPEGLDRPQAMPRVRGEGRGGRGGRTAAGGAARGEAEELFGAAEVEEEKRGGRGGGAGERSGAAVMDRLTSLIKMALDDRLIDSYEASRKRNRAVALPYQEADLVY